MVECSQLIGLMKSTGWKSISARTIIRTITLTSILPNKTLNSRYHMGTQIFKVQFPQGPRKRFKVTNKSGKLERKAVVNRRQGVNADFQLKMLITTDVCNCSIESWRKARLSDVYLQPRWQNSWRMFSSNRCVSLCRGEVRQIAKKNSDWTFVGNEERWMCNRM